MVSQEQEFFDIDIDSVMSNNQDQKNPRYVMKTSIMNLFKRCGLKMPTRELSVYVANSLVNEGNNHFHLIGSAEYKEIFKKLLFDYEFQDPNFMSVFIHDNTNNVKELAAKRLKVE